MTPSSGSLAPCARRAALRGFAMLLLLAALVSSPAVFAEGEPLRVASLLPHVSEAVARSVGPEAIVASVRSRPSQPPSVGADLGSPHSPNLEGLAAARPQWVIADATLHRRFTADLKASGATVIWAEGDGVAGTFEDLITIGDTIGGGDAMRKHVAAARIEVANAKRDDAGRMLVLFGTPGRFFVLTDRHWLGDLAQRVGYTLELASIPEDPSFPGLLPVSDEHLVTLRPNRVALVAHGDPTAIREAFERKLEGGGAWKPLRDAAQGGVHVLDAHHFAANPGLAMGAAARRLSTLGDAPDVASEGR